MSTPDRVSVGEQSSEGDRIIVQPQYYTLNVDDLFPALGAPPPGEGHEVIADAVADDVRRRQAYGRLYLPPQAWNDFRITTNSPTVQPGYWLVKNSMAVVHALIVSAAGTAWVVSIFDSAAGVASGSPIFRYLTAMGIGVFLLDIKVNGALIITATGTPGELVMTYL